MSSDEKLQYADHSKFFERLNTTILLANAYYANKRIQPFIDQIKILKAAAASADNKGILKELAPKIERLRQEYYNTQEFKKRTNNKMGQSMAAQKEDSILEKLFEIFEEIQKFTVDKKLTLGFQDQISQEEAIMDVGDE